MLTPRYVVEHVAQRYGKLAPIFNIDAQKLELLRSGQIDITTLDGDRDRVRKRLAREAEPSVVRPERIMGLPDFQDKNVLEKLSLLSKAVCRILKKGNAYGTGFLVAENILLTNHHVIESPEDASDMLAEFNYELDINNYPSRSAIFKLNPETFFFTSTLLSDPENPDSGLDCTLIGIEGMGLEGAPLTQFPPILLDGNKGKIIKGESCVIIQHPNGLPKKIVIGDTAFFSETATRLVYESDTLPGSSGSPVIGLGTCEIVALHHSGLPKTDSNNRIITKDGSPATDTTSDDEIEWVGNEGIKISKIIEAVSRAHLPAAMETLRTRILQKTNTGSDKLQDLPVPTESFKPVNMPEINSSQMVNAPVASATSFLIVLLNKPIIIRNIEVILSSRYGTKTSLQLSMPAVAVENEEELFYFSAVVKGDVNTEAQQLLNIPGVINAEADVPLALNADNTFDSVPGQRVTESFFEDDQGLGTWDEPAFLSKYKDSQYVDEFKLAETRKWNWAATNFDIALQNASDLSPLIKRVSLVQFDTGFTDHSKIAGGLDTDDDFNFITNTDDASDPKALGIGRHPGHGTRTASLIIGNKPEGDPSIDHNGNEGFLSSFGYKLVPFRISQSVILIDRQQQLAAALDMAISRGFDIITMSMGLPPTIATSKMAKKAYDKGVIWCCAAGNVVQAVIAPAVYPGTIAVAASNPMDRDWSGSSRGDTVDITAPGEDVYVPIWNMDRQEDYAYGNGTSYATPLVASAAALWLAKYHTELLSPEYAGWRRPEAFKAALAASARRNNDLPRKGFGHGMLDVGKLLETPPVKADQLKYAYDSWNEHAFFASLQGYGELLKTYWNKLHGLFFKTKRGGQESLESAVLPLSPLSQNIERTLFRSPVSIAESSSEISADMLQRYNKINELALQNH